MVFDPHHSYDDIIKRRKKSELFDNIILGIILVSLTATTLLLFIEMFKEKSCL
jgi:uncharacterized membrane protein